MSKYMSVNLKFLNKNMRCKVELICIMKEFHYFNIVIIFFLRSTTQHFSVNSTLQFLTLLIKKKMAAPWSEKSIKNNTSNNWKNTNYILEMIFFIFIKNPFLAVTKCWLVHRLRRRVGTFEHLRSARCLCTKVIWMQ